MHLRQLKTVSRQASRLETWFCWTWFCWFCWTRYSVCISRFHNNPAPGWWGDKVISECFELIIRIAYSNSALESLDTLQGACEELISVNILCGAFLCLITPLTPVHTQPSRPGLEEQGGLTQPSLRCSVDALIRAASLLRSLSHPVALRSAH